jgi:hypothetical protein
MAILEPKECVTAKKPKVYFGKKMNSLASEKIYEYFSKHAAIHKIDENLYDSAMNKVIKEAC